MPEPAPDEAAALEYLRRHGGTYSLEALAEQLRQAGATQEAIDRAAAAYRAQPKEERRWSGTVVGRAFLIAGVTLLLALLPFLSGPDSRGNWSGDFFVACLLELGLAVVGFLVGAAVYPRRKAAGRALLAASLIDIALAGALLAITIGTCRIGG